MSLVGVCGLRADEIDEGEVDVFAIAFRKSLLDSSVLKGLDKQFEKYLCGMLLMERLTSLVALKMPGNDCCY